MTDTFEMTDTVTKSTTRVAIEPDLELLPPKNYKVIYINDEVTTQQFVVESLMSIFDYTEEAAEDITMQVHEHGAASVAVLPYEIAEQKGVEVTVFARNNGFPLQVKLEPES